jgi:hypothetical protein
VDRAGRKAPLIPDVSEEDFSFLVTILAVLVSEHDLWIDPTIPSKHSGRLAPESAERARRLLDALKPLAKSNGDLSA